MDDPINIYSDSDAVTMRKAIEKYQNYCSIKKYEERLPRPIIFLLT